MEQQLLIAAGKPVSFDVEDLAPAGHAIELRINAEDPTRFLPGPGRITTWEEPSGMASGWTAATQQATPSHPTTTP